MASLLHVLRWIFIIFSFAFAFVFYSLVRFFFFSFFRNDCERRQHRTSEEKKKKTNLFIFIFYFRSNRRSFLLVFLFFLYCIVCRRKIEQHKREMFRTKLKWTNYWLLNVQLSYDWRILFVFELTIFNTFTVYDIYVFFIEMRLSRCVIALCCSVYASCVLCMCANIVLFSFHSRLRLHFIETN